MPPPRVVRFREPMSPLAPPRLRGQIPLPLHEADGPVRELPTTDERFGTYVRLAASKCIFVVLTQMSRLVANCGEYRLMRQAARGCD